MVYSKNFNFFLKIFWSRPYGVETLIYRIKMGILENQWLYSDRMENCQF